MIKNVGPSIIVVGNGERDAVRVAVGLAESGLEEGLGSALLPGEGEGLAGRIVSPGLVVVLQAMPAGDQLNSQAVEGALLHHQPPFAIVSFPDHDAAMIVREGIILVGTGAFVA